MRRDGTLRERRRIGRVRKETEECHRRDKRGRRVMLCMVERKMGARPGENERDREVPCQEAEEVRHPYQRQDGERLRAWRVDCRVDR